MPYCINCGAGVEVGGNFCGSCGNGLGQTARLGYPISLNRILFLTIVSFGLYLFYWFYLTWRHYRDHTGNEAYPIWHALTLLIPIYGLFRIHAHVRSYNELMSKSGLLGSIDPMWVVAVFLITNILGIVANILTGGLFGTDDYTFVAAVSAAILFAVSLALYLRVLLPIQSDLNRYWESLANVQIVPSKVRVGEVVFSIIGLFAWMDTIWGLLSESYRAAGTAGAATPF